MRINLGVICLSAAKPINIATASIEHYATLVYECYSLLTMTLGITDVAPTLI